MTTIDRVDRTKRLVNELLDAGYEAVVGQVIASITRSTESGVVAKRLGELQAEAERLAAAGQTLSPDNAVLRALLADLETVLRTQARAVDGAAEAVQAAGSEAGGTLARQLTLPGVDDAQLQALGIDWQSPSPEAVAQSVAYVNGAGWAQEMQAFGANILTVIGNIAVGGLAEGRNPRTTARELVDTVQGLPLYQAHNLMRTLFLTSYRDAASLEYVANANILDGQIRIGTLDGRICLACLALHGTELPIGARVDDHHQGRCVAIGKVRGRKYTVQTGVDYWDGLSDTRKLELAGPANFNALQAGAVRLQDFVQPYTDKVFGEMVRENSLKGILGEAAREYYTRG